MECAASSIRGSASKISGATLSGTVSIATADAIHDAGLASAVIINVHLCARLDRGGLDLGPSPVQEADCLAQRIADWAVRAVSTDHDGLARLESRDRAIGRCRRSCGFSR